VVDDDATNRVVLERYRRSWGLPFESVADALGALVAVERAEREQSPFELVLTDMMMPGG
jgi:CheY-like chemotaxis protein